MAPLFMDKTLMGTINISEMTCIELCSQGLYEAWDSTKLKELNARDFREELGQKIMYEDGEVRLWLIELKPKENLSFTRVNRNFKVISHAKGFAVSHRDNGEIVLIQYREGDVFRYNKLEMGDQIWDLENVGADPLQFVIIEETHMDWIKEI